MAEGPAKPTVRPMGVILAAALGLLILFGVGAWWLWPMDFSIGGANTIEAMVAQIRSWGPWAALGSIMLMVAHSFIPFPAEIITIANGMVFGPLLGSVITWVGAMLGALSTFGLVRLLGRPFIHRMLSENQLDRLSAWSATRGGLALLIGRLIPVIAFNLLNYGAALTEISWWTFIWATGLGILPLTILLNVFGDSILTMKTWNWVWLALGALAILVWALARRRSRVQRKSP
ncbi:MAG: TVP38/TMEM64 family protein [Burkholderiales bacterium]|nr:TVP38/TMEM64 family protein [Burkholderiales bacterium]